MVRIVLLLFAWSVAAHAAGFQRATAPDPGHPAIEIGIWYPSEAPVADEPLELFNQSVALDQPMSGTRHPLIVISHGQGSSLAGHYDTALALADAGYVVVALTHTGDNWRDQSQAMNIADRPRQVSRVIDTMLASWDVDPDRIGVIGFSAGGFTALALLGGKPDFSKVGPYCADHPGQYTCVLVAAHGGEASGMTLDADMRDDRIKAAVVMAPAVAFTFIPDGLRGITAPIQLWRADADQILPAPDYADAIRTALPSPPEFQTVANAGHFDFLAPCSPALAAQVPMICADAPGFDRAAFHARLNATVKSFFGRTLPPSP